MTIEDEAEKILRLLGAKAKDKAKNVYNYWKVKSLVEQASATNSRSGFAQGQS